VKWLDRNWLTSSPDTYEDKPSKLFEFSCSEWQYIFTKLITKEWNKNKSSWISGDAECGRIPAESQSCHRMSFQFDDLICRIKYFLICVENKMRPVGSNCLLPQLHSRIWWPLTERKSSDAVRWPLLNKTLSSAKNIFTFLVHSKNDRGAWGDSKLYVFWLWLN